MVPPSLLQIVEGEDQGRALELVPPEVKVGRGADQDLVLTDLSVSRRHFTLQAEGERWRLRDLGSGNGTLVNGQRVDGVLLDHGDEIALGNTRMRFSRLAAPAPDPRPPPASSDPVVVRPASLPLPYTVSLPIRLVTSLQAPRNRLLAHGVMGIVSLLCLGLLWGRATFGKAPRLPSEAEERYHQGLSLFAAQDYEGAKASFRRAEELLPGVAAIGRYLSACDREMQARAAWQAAERASAEQHYAQAVQALDGIDANSLLRDEATRRRQELAPRAAAQETAEARAHMGDDPDTARNKLTRALRLDPGNPEARRLAARLQLELPSLPASASAMPGSDTRRPGRPVELAPRPEPPARAPRAEPARQPAPRQTARPAEREAARATLSSDALAAYRARDFGGAERLSRATAVGQTGQARDLSLAFADQVRELKRLIERSVAEEGQSPQAAIKDLQSAKAIDGRIGGGRHAGYFAQRIGRLALLLAQESFAQGKYDLAYSSLRQAKHAGIGDDGLARQLESKAKELTDRGEALGRSNPSQAKQYWRMVIRMVPSSSRVYARAYQLLNQRGAHDEDEN